MRADETTDRKHVTSLLPEILPTIGAHLPEVSNHLIIPAKDRHVRIEIGDDEKAFPFMEMARVRKPVDETDVLPIQGKELKTLIAAIGYGQYSSFAARVHRDAVRTS